MFTLLLDFQLPHQRSRQAGRKVGEDKTGHTSHLSLFPLRSLSNTPVWHFHIHRIIQKGVPWLLVASRELRNVIMTWADSEWIGFLFLRKKGRMDVGSVTGSLMASQAHVWLILITSFHSCPTAPEDTLGGRVTEDQRTVTVFLEYEKTQGNQAHMFGAGKLKSEIQSCVWLNGRFCFLGLCLA